MMWPGPGEAVAHYKVSANALTLYLLSPCSSTYNSSGLVQPARYWLLPCHRSATNTITTNRPNPPPYPTKVNGWKLATTINMAIIFFIFGVTLDSSELLSAVKAWKAVLYGMLSMLFLTPLFGFLAVRLPSNPPEFALGLAIMAAVPSSLSSGVTLVIQGYGNGALALLFTVAGNITGIVTAPLMVKLVLGSITNAKVDSLDLLVKLGVSILMPVLVGKALRELVKPIRWVLVAGGDRQRAGV